MIPPQRTAHCRLIPLVPYPSLVPFFVIPTNCQISSTANRIIYKSYLPYSFLHTCSKSNIHKVHIL